MHFSFEVVQGGEKVASILYQTGSRCTMHRILSYCGSFIFCLQDCYAFPVTSTPGNQTNNRTLNTPLMAGPILLCETLFSSSVRLLPPSIDPSDPEAPLARRFQTEGYFTSGKAILFRLYTGCNLWKKLIQ